MIAIQPIPETLQHPAPRTDPGPVLVLGAGGARGLAHIGVLKALESLGIQPSAVVGASMGAQIGVAYALGWTAQRLEQLALRTGKKDTVLAVLSHAKRREILHSLYGHQSLEDALLPVSALATDLSTGTPVILERGPAVPAVLASISIPGLFPALSYQGKTLIDGAMSLPLPISVAKAAYPGRKIIAVSVCHAHLQDVPSVRKGRLATLKRSMQITHRNLILSHVENYPPDLLITPTLSGIDILDLDKAQEIIRAGESAAITAFQSADCRLFRTAY